jgi:hypothetical protein
MSGFIPMLSTVTAADVATAVRSELATELAHLDADVSGVAASVLTAAQTTPIHSDIRRVNDVTVGGTGKQGSEWGPV